MTEEQKRLVDEAWAMHGGLRTIFRFKYPECHQAIEDAFVDLLIQNAPLYDPRKCSVRGWARLLLKFALARARGADFDAPRIIDVRDEDANPANICLDLEDPRVEEFGLSIDVQRILDSLPSLERYVVKSRLQGDRLTAIASSLGTTRQWAFTVFERAIARLRCRFGEFDSPSVDRGIAMFRD